MKDTILRVALPAPVWTLYDYLPPADIDPALLQPGQRLRVPLGNGRRCGLLVELAQKSSVARGKLKPALALLDRAAPLLPPEQLDFLRWVADYYHHPLGEVLFSALPARLRKGRALARDPSRVLFLLERDEARLEEMLRRATAQLRVVRWLLAHGGEATEAAFRKDFPKGLAPLRALLNRGVVEWRAPLPPQPRLAAAPTLSSEQQQAVDQVAASFGGFRPWLLQGVTGSGKTEVYLQLAARVLARGRSVLVLVPEIALTPQLVGRFRERLGLEPALLHSARADGERERDWLRAKSGRAPLVIGTRSAVLAPLPELGLVVVDEEHDGSYKQQEGARYSARDLALVRAQRAGCPVVLGSATPSLESLKNAREGRYGWLRLNQRVGGGRMPAMRLLDVRAQPLEGGLSRPLLARMEETLVAGRQVMVFLNRRGYAPVVICHACGWLSDCPHCDARQTLHRAWKRLVCHHCGAERPLPSHCPACGADQLHPLGQGTERLERELARRFGGYPLVRIDRDTTSRRGSLEELLNQVRAGGPALLVGTQMLAKGHHFPEMALVVVVDLDAGLFSADFRAAERTAQLVVQVAGRAGRERHAGEVVLQTRFPDHPLLQTLVNGGYEAFAEEALAERRLAALPPYSYQALLRAAAVKMARAEAFLARAADLASEIAGSSVAIWGPVPAPMPRRANRYRAQLLFQADERPVLQRMLNRLVPRLSELPEGRGVRWSLDVDPVDLY